VTSAFMSFLKVPRYTNPVHRRPVWVQTDRGKNFLNKSFQVVLKREGIDFHVCRNPDVKCVVVVRVHRTSRNKLYRYFTYKNTYRFVDVLLQLVKAYNDTVQSSIGIGPSAVTDRHVLEIWTRMNRKLSRARVGRVRFRVGQHVIISQEKMKFAKGSEQNYTDEIFKIAKVINRKP
jgi:hypothetical protein